MYPAQFCFLFVCPPKFPLPKKTKNTCYLFKTVYLSAIFSTVGCKKGGDFAKIDLSSQSQGHKFGPKGSILSPAFPA